MSLFGSTKTTTKTDSGPWKEQQGYIKDAFQQSQNLFNAKSGTSAYDGERYAGMDPLSSGAANSQGAFAQGAGANAANQFTSAGLGMLGQNGNYLDALSGFNQAAGADNTQHNISAAGQYANNPYLTGQIDAASRDVVRNLSENALPSIDRAAVDTGNINSSRTGIAEGIAQRGAQDQIGDIAANMRGQAYNTGLGMAQQDSQYRTNALGSAAGMYGNAVNQGAGIAQQGVNQSYDNFNKQNLAGSLFQQNQQGMDNAAQQQWQDNDTRQQQLLNNYYGTIGANNWGTSGTSTTKTKSNPGILGAAMGLGSLAASFMAPGSGALMGGLGGGASSGLMGMIPQMTAENSGMMNVSPMSSLVGRVG